MKVKFRPLEAEEISVRIAKVNKGGVKLLLWKNCLADLTILEDALDTTDYEVTYPSEGICRISIWDPDKSLWVSREGVGEGSTPKSLANDSLQRAGTAWGIGRELYTTGDIFIFKDKLKSYKEEKDETGKDICNCYDDFTVSDIAYESGKVVSLKIAVSQYGKVHSVVDFSFSTTPEKKEARPEKREAVPEKEKAQSVTTAKFPLAEDEIILMGNCRGKTYKEVRDTPAFQSFLRWAGIATPRYQDAAAQAQFEKIKSFAETLLS